VPGCHTWRATGITIYLEIDGRLQHTQRMAGHESPQTTKLYDRTKDEITLSEVGAHPVVKFVSKRHCETANARFDAASIFYCSKSGPKC
jgi:hypothetical protein